MAQPCVSESIRALKDRKPEHFIKELNVNHEELYKAFISLIDPDMRNYFNVDSQIPCNIEMFSRLLRSFTEKEKQITIRYFICTLSKGAHETGGLLYRVEQYLLYTDQPPIIYDSKKESDIKKKKESFLSNVTPDVDEYAFVLRSSRNVGTATIGAGHMMLVNYDDNLVSKLLIGEPATGLK